MTERIRWGILSTGHIASVLTEDLGLLIDEAAVVAVASRDQAKADAYARKWKIPRAYASYAELAADEDVDVVYVASPHHDHLPSSKLLLESGKAVLCEKPMTVSAQQTGELVDLAANRTLFLMEAMWMRTNPVIRKAAELVASGDLGPVRHVRTQFGFRFDGEPSHRLVNPDLAGGGILDLGVYPMHAVNLFLGEPSQVQAAGSTGPTGVDTNSTALLAFAASDSRPAATATVHCTLESNLVPRLEILCADGWIDVDNFIRSERMTVHRRGADQPEEFVTQLPGNGYTLQLQEVMRCMRAGEIESPLVPWQSSLEVARTLDAWLAGVHACAAAAAR